MAKYRVLMEPFALAFLFLLSFLTHASAEESRKNSTTLPSTTTSVPKILFESKAVKSALAAVKYHKSHTSSSSSSAKTPSDRPKKYTVKVTGDDGDEEGRYIIIDSGSTDTNGIASFLIAFGSIGFAIMCALGLLGVVLAVLDKIQATPSTTPTTYTGYGSPAPLDSYSSYKRALDVSRALEQGYSQYAGSDFQESGPGML